MKNANINKVKNGTIVATNCALGQAMGNNCQGLSIA